MKIEWNRYVVPAIFAILIISTIASIPIARCDISDYPNYNLGTLNRARHYWTKVAVTDTTQQVTLTRWEAGHHFTKSIRLDNTGSGDILYACDPSCTTISVSNDRANLPRVPAGQSVALDVEATFVFLTSNTVATNNVRVESIY
jgi:hypothetical protein